MIFNAFGENFSQYKSSKMKKKPPIHAGIALFYNPRVKLRKKLEEMGVIKGASLEVDPQKLGYDITAFLGIFLEKGSQYNEAVKQLKTVKEIVELHYTTGAWSIFAKIVCHDTTHLREVLNEQIQSVKGIQRTETFISLEETIRRQITLE